MHQKHHLVTFSTTIEKMARYHNRYTTQKGCNTWGRTFMTQQGIIDHFIFRNDQEMLQTHHLDTFSTNTEKNVQISLQKVVRMIAMIKSLRFNYWLSLHSTIKMHQNTQLSYFLNK
jgi:hypothetical protein